MKHILDECLTDIKRIFSLSSNKYEAHLRSQPVLYRMARNEEVIQEIIRRNIQSKAILHKTSCTPDFQLSLIDSPECFMFVNIFGPNKEGNTDVSYSTMHHHDDYLLSTINAKGPGYTSLIFEQGYNIDAEEDTAEVNLEKYVLHEEGHIEFIDCHTAHTLFYPESLTMTYGLWSTSYPTSRMNKLKQSPIIQKNKKMIKNFLSTLRVSEKKLGLNAYREDYFYPEGGVLKFLSGQVLPDAGPHFFQNFFHIVMNFISFQDINFLRNCYSSGKFDSPVFKEFLEKAIEKEYIPRNYDGYDMFIPKRNVAKEEYHKIYQF